MGVVVKNCFFDVKNKTILPAPIKPLENILLNHFERVYLAKGIANDRSVYSRCSVDS